MCRNKSGWIDWGCKELFANQMEEVFRDDYDDMWYFFDETWSKTYGPYGSYKEAAEQMRMYCIHVLGEDPENEDV